jgi:curved DNA-binding protein CbpA
VANKNLYEVLEVVPAASAETIETQYQSLLKRLAGKTHRGTASDLERMALEEAHRTLINPELRKRYDARIAPPVAVHPSMEQGAPSWLARNRRMLLLFGLLAVCGFGYLRHVEDERVAELRVMRDRQALAERQQQAKLAEEARAKAEAEQPPARPEQLVPVKAEEPPAKQQ